MLSEELLMYLRKRLGERMNILCLTNEYPNKNYPKKDSPWIVPFFAREWVKQGNKVIVIVNSTKFPLICYWGVNLIKPFLMKKYNITESNLSSRIWAKPFDLIDEGVRVYNRPMFKYIPSGNFSETRCKHQVKKITDILDENGFVPDVITGHWLNPQLRLISMLTEHYKCRSAFVFHSEVTKKYINKYNVRKYIKNIHRIGCRSKTNSEILKKNLGLPNDPFVCPSGIPDQYIEGRQATGKTIRDRELQIICAGRLVNYKRIDAVIESCAGFDKNEIGQLTIVGEGQLREELEECAKKNGFSDRIVFTGRVERDTLIKKMYQSDIFALISEREVFGLVYLEAMLQGCIVIAAKGGGIDGIIIDGVNGFLCEQGDPKELSKIISKILRMTDAERKQISEKASETAAQYSDSQTAKKYLSNIME